MISGPVITNTDLPWIETKYQWLKDTLNVYIVADLESVGFQNIAENAVNKWVDLLKKISIIPQLAM